MSTEHSDSVLGNQGMQEFTALTSGNASTKTPGGGTTSGAAAGAPGQNLAAKNDGQAGTLPTKTADQTGNGNAGQTGQDGQQQTGQQIDTQTPGANVVTPQQTPPAQQSQADLIRATVEAVTQSQIQARQAEQRQAQAAANAPKTLSDLSPDEFNARFKVVTVTPEHMAAILDQNPQKAAASLNAILQNAVQQAVLMASEVNAAHVKHLEGQFRPHIDAMAAHQQTVREQTLERNFFTKFPELTAERETVMAMKDALLARVQTGQVRFANETEAFSAVANATKQLLTRMGWKPPVGTSPNQQAQTTGQQSSRQMSAASSAGRTGTGQATAKTSVEEVFGADAR